MKEGLNNRLKNIMRIGFLFLALLVGAILGTAFKLSENDKGAETVGLQVTQAGTEYLGTTVDTEGTETFGGTENFEGTEAFGGTEIFGQTETSGGLRPAATALARNFQIICEKVAKRQEMVAQGNVNQGQSAGGSQNSGNQNNGNNGQESSGNQSQGGQSENQGTGVFGGETSQGQAGGKTPKAGHPSSAGALAVKGTQLCDSKGNPIQLRGLSTHGLAWFPDYVNETFFAQLRNEWNVNVVRLAMYTAESGGYCTGGDPGKLKQLVKNGVRYATNQDLYVIIDWHILSDGNPNSHINEARAFFQEMSKAYASNNNVIYEICNEPNGNTSWADVKRYANEIIPVIRANDPEAVILVGTPNWCQYVDQAANSPLTGYSNIMYTLHFYADTHRESLRNTMTSAINGGLPVFVSEYGICDASGSGSINESEANAWVQLMDAYGVSYVAWNISNKNETSSIFKSSCGKTSGFAQEDLSSSGKWLYRMLTNGSGGMSAGGSSGGNAGSTGGSAGSSGGGNSGNSGNSGGSTGSTGGNSGNSGGNNGSSGSTASRILKKGDVEIGIQLLNSWQSGEESFYQYSISLKNISGSAGTGWAIDVQFNEKFSFSSGWNGNYSANGSTLHISSMDYNGSLSAGGTTGDIGFIVSGGSSLKVK